MSVPYTLRPIRPDDGPLLFEIYASTRADEMARVPWDDAQKEAFLRMQFDAQHKFYQDTFPDAEFRVIMSGDRPVGRLYVDRRAAEIRIVDIALLPESRNSGIGTSLLREVMAEAEKANKPVRIHVERNNPALSLYIRLGFEEIDDTGVYLLMERVPRTIV